MEAGLAENAGLTLSANIDTRGGSSSAESGSVALIACSITVA